MTQQIVIAWVLIGLAGGLRWSQDAYRFKTALLCIVFGCASGPISFLYSFKE